jgi:hypothetical protein
MNNTNLIEKYNIALSELSSLNESEKKIFESLKNQFEIKQTLSDKQNDLLTKILKREFNISNIEYTKYNLYKEYFYRADYNGDYLKDSKYIILEDESDVILNEEIQNLHARQYNYIDYEKRYEFDSIIAIPSCIKNIHRYLPYSHHFEKLIMKLPRARSLKSKYNIVKAIKTILNEEYNQNTINNVLKYKHWY